jgi:hypothetical protein
MMATTFATLALGGVLAVANAGCGSGASTPTPASPTSEHEVATGSTLTEFQKGRLLGHYSTQDGASGFILDRTTTPWRAKLDGVAKIVNLSESGGPYDTKEYRSDDKSIWLRVDADGTVVLFQGPKQTEGVRVVRDADAAQLK